jgi:hypothetical protein
LRRKYRRTARSAEASPLPDPNKRRLSERLLDLIELRVRVGADCLDGTQANHNDQGEHHGVLDRGGAVFGNQELFHEHFEVFHGGPLAFW